MCVRFASIQFAHLRDSVFLSDKISLPPPVAPAPEVATASSVSDRRSQLLKRKLESTNTPTLPSAAPPRFDTKLEQEKLQENPAN